MPSSSVWEVVVFSIESLRLDHFDWSTALSLVTASKIAYERQDILTDVVVGKWGFRRHVALNRGDTQGFIAAGLFVI